MGHIHRKIPKLERVVPWTHCVAPTSGYSHGEGAHGGVEIIDTCRCGAIRHTESSMSGKRYGVWIIPP